MTIAQWNDNHGNSIRLEDTNDGPIVVAECPGRRVVIAIERVHRDATRTLLKSGRLTGSPRLVRYFELLDSSLADAQIPIFIPLLGGEYELRTTPDLPFDVIASTPARSIWNGKAQSKPERFNANEWMVLASFQVGHRTLSVNELNDILGSARARTAELESRWQRIRAKLARGSNYRVELTELEDDGGSIAFLDSFTLGGVSFEPTDMFAKGLSGTYVNRRAVYLHLQSLVEPNRNAHLDLEMSQEAIDTWPAAAAALEGSRWRRASSPTVRTERLSDDVTYAHFEDGTASLYGPANSNTGNTELHLTADERTVADAAFGLTTTPSFDTEGAESLNDKFETEGLPIRLIFDDDAPITGHIIPVVELPGLTFSRSTLQLSPPDRSLANLVHLDPAEARLATVLAHTQHLSKRDVTSALGLPPEVEGPPSPELRHRWETFGAKVSHASRFSIRLGPITANGGQWFHLQPFTLSGRKFTPADSYFSGDTTTRAMERLRTYLALQQRALPQAASNPSSAFEVGPEVPARVTLGRITDSGPKTQTVDVSVEGRTYRFTSSTENVQLLARLVGLQDETNPYIDGDGRTGDRKLNNALQAAEIPVRAQSFSRKIRIAGIPHIPLLGDAFQAGSLTYTLPNGQQSDPIQLFDALTMAVVSQRQQLTVAEVFEIVEGPKTPGDVMQRRAAISRANAHLTEATNGRQRPVLEGVLLRRLTLESFELHGFRGDPSKRNVSYTDPAGNTQTIEGIDPKRYIFFQTLVGAAQQGSVINQDNLWDATLGGPAGDSDQYFLHRNQDLRKLGAPFTVERRGQYARLHGGSLPTQEWPSDIETTQRLEAIPSINPNWERDTGSYIERLSLQQNDGDWVLALEGTTRIARVSSNAARLFRALRQSTVTDTPDPKTRNELHDGFKQLGVPVLAVTTTAGTNLEETPPLNIPGVAFDRRLTVLQSRADPTFYVRPPADSIRLLHGIEDLLHQGVGTLTINELHALVRTFNPSATRNDAVQLWNRTDRLIAIPSKGTIRLAPATPNGGRVLRLETVTLHGREIDPASLITPTFVQGRQYPNRVHRGLLAHIGVQHLVLGIDDPNGDLTQLHLHGSSQLSTIAVIRATDSHPDLTALGVRVVGTTSGTLTTVPRTTAYVFAESSRKSARRRRQIEHDRYTALLTREIHGRLAQHGAVHMDELPTAYDIQPQRIAPAVVSAVNDLNRLITTTTQRITFRDGIIQLTAFTDRATVDFAALDHVFAEPPDPGAFNELLGSLPTPHQRAALIDALFGEDVLDPELVAAIERTSAAINSTVHIYDTDRHTHLFFGGEPQRIGDVITDARTLTIRRADVPDGRVETLSPRDFSLFLRLPHLATLRRRELRRQPLDDIQLLFGVANINTALMNIGSQQHFGAHSGRVRHSTDHPHEAGGLGKLGIPYVTTDPRSLVASRSLAGTPTGQELTFADSPAPVDLPPVDVNTILESLVAAPRILNDREIDAVDAHLREHSPRTLLISTPPAGAYALAQAPADLSDELQIDLSTRTIGTRSPVPVSGEVILFLGSFGNEPHPWNYLRKRFGLNETVLAAFANNAFEEAGIPIAISRQHGEWERLPIDPTYVRGLLSLDTREAIARYEDESGIPLTPHQLLAVANVTRALGPQRQIPGTAQSRTRSIALSIGLMQARQSLAEGKPVATRPTKPSTRRADRQPEPSPSPGTPPRSEPPATERADVEQLRIDSHARRSSAHRTARQMAALASADVEPATHRPQPDAPFEAPQLPPPTTWLTRDVPEPSDTDVRDASWVEMGSTHHDAPGILHTFDRHGNNVDVKLASGIATIVRRLMSSEQVDASTVTEVARSALNNQLFYKNVPLALSTDRPTLDVLSVQPLRLPVDSTSRVAYTDDNGTPVHWTPDELQLLGEFGPERRLLDRQRVREVMGADATEISIAERLDRMRDKLLRASNGRVVLGHPTPLGVGVYELLPYAVGDMRVDPAEFVGGDPDALNAAVYVQQLVHPERNGTLVGFSVRNGPDGPEDWSHRREGYRFLSWDAGLDALPEAIRIAKERAPRAPERAPRAPERAPDKVEKRTPDRAEVPNTPPVPMDRTTTDSTVKTPANDQPATTRPSPGSMPRQVGVPQPPSRRGRRRRGPIPDLEPSDAPTERTAASERTPAPERPTTSERTPPSAHPSSSGTDRAPYRTPQDELAERQALESKRNLDAPTTGDPTRMLGDESTRAEPLEGGRGQPVVDTAPTRDALLEIEGLGIDSVRRRDDGQSQRSERT